MNTDRLREIALRRCVLFLLGLAVDEAKHGAAASVERAADRSHRGLLLPRAT
jgi:hypothetical protein